MGLSNDDMICKRLFCVGLAAILSTLVAACSQETPPHLRPLSKEAMHLLGKKGMSPQSPILIRIFKEESELEVWKARADGRFYHFKTYPICNWSGGLGPKLREGDKQAPEGFYTVTQRQMNPNSKFHLSFNLGYPNAYDRAFGRTGDFLMVHGDCRSAGCYAMTDALVEEIYALAREAFAGGQQAFQVHAFPFRMTDRNMRRHRNSQWYGFWRQLKEGYDYFELTRRPPRVAVCGRRYLVNVSFVGGREPRDGRAPCPPYRKERIEVWAERPLPGSPLAERVVVRGRKMRNLALERRLDKSGNGATRYGLTKAAGGFLGLQFGR